MRLDATGGRDMQIRVSHGFDSTHELASVRRCIEKLINDLVHGLAFETDIPCGPAIVVRDDIDDVAKRSKAHPTTVVPSADGTATVHSGEVIRASVSPGRIRVTQVLIVGPEREGELAASLATEPAHLSKAIYASILRTIDPIGRFILLYGFLQVLVGGEGSKQECVDRWVERKRPDVERSTRPGTGKPGKSETLYSRLRNEIAHGLDPKRDVNIDELRREVQRAIKEFRALVKEAIVGSTGP